MSKRGDDDSSSSSDSDSYESDDCDTFFWGCTLTRQNPIVRWGEKMDDSRCSAFFQEHRLSIRQAVLGAGAVEGERNVVAVDCENYDKEMVELPILSLTLNHQDMCAMNMNFDWPCIFRLGQGSGPVVLTGEHHVTYLDDDDDDDEDDDDEDSESSSSSSERSLKSKKKDKKTATPSNTSRMSSSSSTVKGSSKSRAKKTRRSESSEKSEKKKKPSKSGSKGRPSKEAGAKNPRGSGEGKAKKKKKVTGGKKVAKKKTQTNQVKVKEEAK